MAITQKIKCFSYEMVRQVASACVYCCSRVLNSAATPRVIICPYTISYKRFGWHYDFCGLQFIIASAIQIVVCVWVSFQCLWRKKAWIRTKDQAYDINSKLAAACLYWIQKANLQVLLLSQHTQRLLSLAVRLALSVIL